MTAQERAQTLIAQARRAHMAGQDAEAEAAYLEAVELLRSGRVASGALVTAIAYNLGCLYFAQARYSEARQQFVRARKAWRADSFPDPTEIQSGLAEAYFKERSYKKAEKAFEELLAMPGLEGQMRAECLYGAGFFYHFLGNFAACEPLLRECLALTPVDSLLAARAWERLGLMYESLDPPDSPRIGDSYRHMLESSEVWGVREQEMLAAGCARMGKWHFGRGELGPAESYFGRMARALANLPEHLDPSWMREAYADFLRETGRSELSEATPAQPGLSELMVFGASLAHKNVGPLEQAEMLLDRGNVAEFEGNYGQAKECYRQSLQLLEMTLGLDHPQLCRVLCCLARLYPPEAKALLERALRIVESHPGSLQERAQTWETVAQFEGSRDRYRGVLELQERLHGLTSSAALECRWRFGQLCLRLGEAEEALDVLRLLVDRSRKNQEIQELELVDFLASLAQALEKCGYEQEAAQARWESEQKMARARKRQQ